MKAVIYENVNSFKYCDNNREPNVDGEMNIKLKVMYCGICGSDLHKLLHERPNLGYIKTKILGHELVGKVVNIGKCERDDIKIGDIVVVEPLLYCTKCEMCNEGRIQFCKNIRSLGRELQGGFAEYVVVNERQVYKIDDDVDKKNIALSDPYSVSIHIRNIINEKNKKIGIIGDGVIGLATAKVLGENNEIILFGKHSNRKEILNELNIKYYSNEKVSEFNNYFDIVVEAVGGRQNTTLSQAISITKPKGKIIVSGVFDNNFEFNIPLRQSFYKELSIIGCNSFEKSKGISDFEVAVEYLSSKSKIASRMISKVFKIEEFEKVIEYIKNKSENNCIKILIEL